MKKTIHFTRKVFVFMLIFMVQVAHAQELKGTVTDEHGSSIEFANVVVLSADSSFILGTTTDGKGEFHVQKPKDHSILKVTYIGYRDNYVDLDRLPADSVLRVRLQKGEIQLSEVTVKGNRPLFRQKEGVLTTQVHGTILSKINSISDLLLQIPGVVKGRTGDIETFGKGSPIIYINNREVKSTDELDRLVPSDIQQVELLTSPGPKYRANGRAVIKITTVNKEEGFSLLARGLVSQNERTSFGQSARLGYQFKNINITGSYDYEHARSSSTQPSVKELHVGNNIHRYESPQRSKESTPKLNFALSIDCSIDTCNSIGLSWDGNTYKDTEDRNAGLGYSLNGTAVQNTQVASRYKNSVTYHHLNAFYLLSKQSCTFGAYADFVHNNNDYHQNTNESTNDLSTLNTVSDGDAKQNMASLKIDYNQKLGNTTNLSLGVDFSYTKARGTINISSNSMSNSSYKTHEYLYGAYVELSKRFGSVSTKAGVRYEDYIYKYNNLISQIGSKNTFNNLFPSLSISYGKGGWSHTLSFTSQVVRPSFRQMSNSNYYMNEYMYQRGNPQLEPTRIYQAQLYSTYKWITLSAGYSFKKDYIQSYFENSGNDNIIVTTYKNFDHIPNLNFFINVQKGFGIWSPSLTVGLDQPFFKSEYLGRQMRHNRASFYCVLSQILSLPHDYMISSYIYFNSGGNQGSVELLPFHTTNITLQKTFFKSKLTISLQGNDLFRGMKFREKDKIGSVNFTQTEDYHLWKYSFNITYRLNSKNTKYRGKNTLDKEIKRL